MPKRGVLHQLIDLLSRAFFALDAKVSSRQIEFFAVTVHRAMTLPGRVYHTLEHVYSLSDPDNPIQTLAATFHDVVYYQVDGGILPEVGAVVNPCILDHGNSITLPDLPNDSMLYLTMEVFGFEPGQTIIPSTGLNEFLSALFAVKCLETTLPCRVLASMGALIEATIPFRGINSAGQTCFDLLEERLRKINERRGLRWTEEEIIHITQSAASFANKDVESFSYPDAALFLDTTWQLLPETNFALRQKGLYTIRDLRLAYQKTTYFMKILKLDNIFHQHRGAPPDEELACMKHRATENLKTGCDYLEGKLLAMAVLEALAEVTGGDAPVVLFLGDIPQKNEHMESLRDYLPLADEPRLTGRSPELVRLLVEGRLRETIFDRKDSPLTHFLFDRLTDEEIDRLLSFANALFSGSMGAVEFLDKIPPPIFFEIASACAAIAITRREELLRLVGDLAQP